MSIRIVGLRKRYGASLAVDGVDIDVPEGKMLVLLGPSGCGKTTTMRCIAGLEEPDEGEISINGRTVFSRRAKLNVAVHERRIGMVFQSYAIWPHMTVHENVAYPLDMADTPRAEKEKRVCEALALVGLDGYGERGASYLSGGQMQRVALARALAGRPALLFADEPTGNLDSANAKGVAELRFDLVAETGAALVLVTPDPALAARADRQAVMADGLIV